MPPELVTLDFNSSASPGSRCGAENSGLVTVRSANAWIVSGVNEVLLFSLDSVMNSSTSATAITK